MTWTRWKIPSGSPDAWHHPLPSDMKHSFPSSMLLGRLAVDSSHRRPSLRIALGALGQRELPSPRSYLFGAAHIRCLVEDETRFSQLGSALQGQPGSKLLQGQWGLCGRCVRIEPPLLSCPAAFLPLKGWSPKFLNKGPGMILTSESTSWETQLHRMIPKVSRQQQQHQQRPRDCSFSRRRSRENEIVFQSLEKRGQMVKDF